MPTRVWLHSTKAIHRLVYRILDDPTDAPDTTQEVFVKVFRGISKFKCEGSLKAWMYRIAIHEASNRRRWYFRHKSQERSIESMGDDGENSSASLFESLAAATESPFETLAAARYGHASNRPCRNSLSAIAPRWFCATWKTCPMKKSQRRQTHHWARSDPGSCADVRRFANGWSATPPN